MQLTSTYKNSVDPELLRQRLLEKESQAERNRLKEIERMQAKIARHDERAREVIERKKGVTWEDELSKTDSAIMSSRHGSGKNDAVYNEDDDDDGEELVY
jgi:hypothetical protein